MVTFPLRNGPGGCPGMRIHLHRSIGLLIILAGALTWVLLAPALPPDGSGASPPPKTESSPIFTPAHPSALEAIRDFFNRRQAPVQPIAYTHKAHLAVGMECLNCHVGVDQGPEARIPSVALCMTCHQAIATDRPEIKKVVAYFERGEEIPWQRVYDYGRSAHVRFKHAVHIRAKVACASCHGDMTQQTTARRVVNLNMGYCLACHKQTKASIDCIACHY